MKALKHIFRIFTGLFLAAAAVLSCDKPFEMDLPLAVNSHKLTLSSTSGSTHILIYADGDWT